MRVRYPSAKKSKSRKLPHRQLRLEHLEPRLLFAQTTLTLHGGDVFQFQNPAGNIERVDLLGNITAQLIGAQVDGNNQIHLVNLPGTLNGAPVNGGIGTPTGSQPIAPITITDSFNPAGSTTTPSIQALAADGAGNVYAVNYVSIPPAVGAPMGTLNTVLVQLVQINPTTGAGNVVADIGDQVNAAVNPLGGQATSIPAAAFNPSTGQLYFVATAGPSNVPKLFSVNVNAGTPVAIQGSVSAVPGTFGITASNTGGTGGTGGTGATGAAVASPITAIAFNGGNLIAAGTPNVSGATTTAGAPQIFSVPLGNTNQIANPQPITVDGTAATGAVSGLAFYPGVANPIAIIGTGANAEVVNVSASSGAGVNWGPLANGATGQNPGGLTFDPALVDPFTGQQGALLATDLATHQLFFVSPQDRIEANSVFAFYVSQSDFTGKIVVSETAGANMTPFSDSIGSLRVIGAQTGQQIVVNSPANSGGSLLGAVTRHVDPNNAADNEIPIIQAPTSGTVNYGVLPGSFTNLHAGLIVAPGNNLGSFLFGGTIMGEVNVGGSVDQFYAGWLLTGNAGGEAAGNISDPRNFDVTGDIRTLIVNGSIGTDSDAALTTPAYESGFDMHTTGWIGTVHSYGSILGAMNADNSPAVVGITSDQQEIEIKSSPGDPWDGGMLGGSPPGSPNSNAIFNNDTFATAQYIAPQNDSGAQLNNGIILDGTLQDDNVIHEKVDYYAVPLLAGQTITAVVHQLIPPPLVLDIAIFDPSGREVYTDYNIVDPSQTQQKPFQFTTNTPGVWRVAVGVTGNGTFTATGGPILGIDVPYTLTLTGLGSTGIGNIVAANNIFDQPNGTPGFGTLQGDLGAMVAGGAIISQSGNTINVPLGSIRTIDGGTMGDQAADPEISVPTGSVGLVQTDTGDMFFNYPLIPSPVGGDWQVVSSAGNFTSKLLADGSIGTIRALQMTNPHGDVPIIEVNATNNVNTPGTIDLIDDSGDFGTLTAGGPHIITNARGNVRFIHVMGATFRDSTFGGGPNEPTEYQFGEMVPLVDDSGSLLSITPEPNVSTTVTNTAASTGGTTGTTLTPGTTVITVTNPTTGLVTTSTVTVVANSDGSFTTTTTVSIPTQLTITAYGIEGSGGLAIMKVSSGGGVLINGGAGTNGLPNQTAEIAEIDTTGTGTPTVPGPLAVIGTPLIPTTSPIPPLTPNGGAQPPGNAGNTGSNSGGSGTGSSTSSTGGGSGGNTDANSGGGALNGGVANNGFTGGTITLNLPVLANNGNTKNTKLNTVVVPPAPILSTTGSALDIQFTGSSKLDVLDIVGTSFTNIVNSTTGEIDDVHATSIGQLASGGSIGLPMKSTPADIMPLATEVTVFPFNQQHTAIVVGGGSSGTATTTTTAGGDIVSVSAPEIGNIDVAGGIGSVSGTIAGPILTGGAINAVNIGSGVMPSGTGDLSRAGIYAGGAIGTVGNTTPADIRGNILSSVGILSLALKNGSIINSLIEDATVFPATRVFVGNTSIDNVITPITFPTLDLGALSVTGNGGIVGSLLAFHHVGSVSSNGFGIFHSIMATLGDGTVQSISANGYGIRGTSWSGGSSIGSISANGNGSLASTATFSSDVRLSESDFFDPFFGFQPNGLTDLHENLGTTAATPVIAGVTDTGVIMDDNFVGNRNLGSVRAYQIRASDPIAAPVTFNFSNMIGSITTTSLIDGMSVITGKLTSFHPAGNLMHTSLIIAGPMKSFVLNGNMLSNSSIVASGPNGNITSIKVLGNMSGTIEADGGKIGTITIAGALNGIIKSRIVGTVNLHAGLTNGSLSISGSATTINVLGSLGASGDTLSVGGNLGTLNIKGNLLTDVHVGGNLKSLIVSGSIITPATIEVDNVLTLLKIGADVQSGVTVKTHVLKKKLIRGLDGGTYITI